MKRNITFKEIKLNGHDLKSVGIYKIINTITGDFYIGSSKRNFKERFKEHCRCYEQFKIGEKHNIHPKLWNAFNKYGIENFSIEILEVLDGKTFKEILIREEFYIHTLNPQYNICKYPTKSGKPNLNRKLNSEWKNKIKEKTKLYKHSEETLKLVDRNNKKNAIKLKFYTSKENLEFSSWIEASKYFNVQVGALRTSYSRNKKYKDWNIEKLTSQKKKIKVFLESDEIIFTSYSECDKYFQMWKGYTSHLITSKCSNLILEKYKYELI